MNYEPAFQMLDFPSIDEHGPSTFDRAAYEERMERRAKIEEVLERILDS